MTWLHSSSRSLSYAECGGAVYLPPSVQNHNLTRNQVLFRLKEGVTPAQLSAFSETAKGMVGKIPGPYRSSLEKAHDLSGIQKSQDARILTGVVVCRLDLSGMWKASSNLSATGAWLRHGPRRGSGEVGHRRNVCHPPGSLGVSKKIVPSSLLPSIHLHG